MKPFFDATGHENHLLVKWPSTFTEESLHWLLFWPAATTWISTHLFFWTDSSSVDMRFWLRKVAQWTDKNGFNFSKVQIHMKPNTELVFEWKLNYGISNTGLFKWASRIEGWDSLYTDMVKGLFPFSFLKHCKIELRFSVQHFIQIYRENWIKRLNVEKLLQICQRIIYIL